MVEVPLFASLRSVLGYTALVSAAAVFLPGHSQLTAGLAILVIALGWETLRPIARVIASLVVCVLLLAGLYNGQVLSSAFDGMAAITGLVLSVMFLSSVLGKSRDLEVISRSLFRGQSLVRYLGLSIGTSTLSVPLNFGSIGLVAPMIGSRIRNGGESMGNPERRPGRYSRVRSLAHGLAIVRGRGHDCYASSRSRELGSTGVECAFCIALPHRRRLFSGERNLG